MKVPRIRLRTGLILLVLAIIGIVIWRRSTTQTEYVEHTAAIRDLRETLELAGEVSAAKSATLRFGTGGLVSYMGAKEGDQVREWQTLASLDTRLLRKTLENKLNLYAIQRGTFDQTLDDNDNSVPGGDLGRTLTRLLQKNQYQLDNTVNDVEYQALSIQLSRIYSPISGILVQSPISVPHVTVAATDTWIVVDPTTLEFIADLDETDLGRVREAQSAIITLDAYSDEEYLSTVKSIDYAPVENNVGTTYPVRLTLPAAAITSLRLGLNGTAALILQEKSGVLTLPSEAVRSVDGRSVVTVRQDDKYLDRPVETGIEQDGFVEIVAGVGVGEHVYTPQI